MRYNHRNSAKTSSSSEEKHGAVEMVRARSFDSSTTGAEHAAEQGSEKGSPLYKIEVAEA